MSVFIVIVTYNGMSWIERCLDSCQLYNTVVVDNASSDSSVSYIKQNYPKVTLLEQSENLGFGAANNIGISYVLNQGAEHIFLLNQDAWLVNDTLSKLIKFQKLNKTYGILSPIHLNATQDKLDSNFSNYLSYNNNPKFYSDYVLDREKDAVYDVPFVNAAAWLISKQCLATVGGFDSIFFHYGEDDNYCQRILYHGFKIGIIPNTFIVHDREDRLPQRLIPFTGAYYNFKERVYKLKFANVNAASALDSFYNELKFLKKRYLKLLLKLKIVEFKGVFKQYRRLKALRESIIYSYKKNKTKGSHYLNV